MIKKLFLALTAIAAATGAHASTVSYEYGMPLALATTEINQTGSLSLFDSSLGTLTGASLQVFGGAMFGFSGTSRSRGVEDATITSPTSLRWSTSLGALSPFLTTVADRIDLSASSGELEYAVGQTRDFGPFVQNGSHVDDLATILASLQATGGGNFDVTCRTVSGLQVLGGGGNINTTQSTSAACGARITYAFDAPVVSQVPEPGSLYLMGMALAGAGFVARRRKQA